MAKPEKRWQLLLVADDGRIVPFKRIKGLVVTLVVLMVILGVACAGLVWQLTAESVRHRNTRDRLADANRQLDHLKGEVELITAELVLAQVRMEKAGLPVVKRQERLPRQPALQQADAEAASLSHRKDNQPQPPSAAATDAAGGDPTDESAAPAANDAGKPAARAAALAQKAAQTPPVVALGDLKVKHDTEKNVLLARFRVKNNALRSGKVAGQCVVVLQNEALDPRSWLALPTATLVGGVPDGKSGRAFKIAKYVDMEIMAPVETDPSVFDVARWYVFEPGGAIIVQKDYPIALPPPAAVRAAKPQTTASATSPSSDAVAGAEEPETPVVGLGDLKMTHDASAKMLRAQFKVENRGSRATPVSGRCVVVLKKAADDSQGWLTMPQVRLVDGEPEGTRGQAFRISRFRNMDIKARGVADPSPFTTATVYVFDSSGNKLLEQSFAVDLPAPPPPPPPPEPTPEPEPAPEPAPQAPPTVTPEAVAPPADVPPATESTGEPATDQPPAEAPDPSQAAPAADAGAETAAPPVQAAPAADAGTETAAPPVQTAPSSDDPSLTEEVETAPQDDTRSRF